MTTLSVQIRRAAGAFALDVAFEAANGVTGVIGPSGAGKSMTLQTIAGLVAPDDGRISLNDELLVDTRHGVSLAPEMRRIGYVFQEPRLFPHMTVAQNLDFGARRRAAGNAVSRDDVIDLLDLSALLERRPHRLSGGEAQRVSIGRALLSAPRLILMDEPLSSLDIRRRREIMPFIEALHRRLDLPIIYVSHNIDEIVRLADRVVVIHDGRVTAGGNVADVLNRRDVQRLLLGESGREDDASTIIEACIMRHDDAHDLSELDVNGVTLTLAHLDLAIGSSVRLRVHARDVAIATEPHRGLSIQNILEAMITELRPVSAAQVDILLTIADGQPLVARITRRSAERLELARGRKVWALVKTVALADGGATEF